MFASASRRLLAYAVDAVLLTAILFLAFIAFGALIGPPIEIQTHGSDVEFTVDVGRTLLAVIVSAAISSAYFVVSWVLFPATPGQRLLGLRVSRAQDSGRLAPGRAVLRWALLLGPLYAAELGGALMPGSRAPLFIVGAVWYAVLLVTTMRSPTGQGLHDRWAGSAVFFTPRRQAA